MNVFQVKKCSEQLRKLLVEQHNAFDAGVKKQIEEVIEALDAAAVEDDRGAGLVALLAITNFLRVASNIVELISKLGND